MATKKNLHLGRVLNRSRLLSIHHHKYRHGRLFSYISARTISIIAFIPERWSRENDLGPLRIRHSCFTVMLTENWHRPPFWPTSRRMLWQRVIVSRLFRIFTSNLFCVYSVYSSVIETMSCAVKGKDMERTNHSDFKIRAVSFHGDIPNVCKNPRQYFRFERTWVKMAALNLTF